MGSVWIWSLTMAVVVILSGLVLLLFLYRRSGPPGTRAAASGQWEQPEEPASSNSSTVADIENKLEKLAQPGLKMWDVKECVSSSDTDSVLEADPGAPLATPQRPAAPRAVHHGPVHLPPSRFQLALPADVHQPPGFHGLFHLRLIYRRDAELQVHWKLTLKTNSNGQQTEPLACWMVDSKDSGLRRFREARKHASVGILQSSSDVLRSENYFMRTSSCRFYLSLHGDYVTEASRAPPARFLVTARRNPETVAPSLAFIHRRDLPDAARLAEFLLGLDSDYKRFMSFFKWRQFYNARRRLTEEKQEFLLLS